MTISPDRDRQPDGCLDAETLAAWADGGLDRAAAAMAEAHVSSCDRCQEIVGLIMTTESQEPAAGMQESWMSRIRAAWLIPLTAGVAAVGLWMIVPANRPNEALRSPQPSSSIARVEAPQAKAAPFAEPSPASEPKRQQAQPDLKKTVPADRPREGFGQEARSNDADAARSKVDAAKNKEEKLADRQPARVDSLAETVTVAPQAPAAAAAPAPAALGRVNAKTSSREIASPNPRTRWRLLSAGNVEYTFDGGVNWEPVTTGVTDRLTAGSSPATDVCWIVGDNGIVLLTTDGRRWQRLAFPETLDLAAVQATDSRSALVTAADGMLFQTKDGGATWTRP